MLGSESSLTGLDLLRLKASLKEDRLQHQLAQSQVLPQSDLRCLRPPPGLAPPCLTSKGTHLEDDVSTAIHSSACSCDDSRSESSLDQRETPQTTLMIRNVPVLYTRDMLATEWCNEGTYDFLYLPYCCSSQRNLSYAFLNFTSEAAALIFVKKWHKQRLAHFSSRKPLNISFADVQGLEPNLLELKKKRVNRVKVEQCQPLIFSNGRSILMSEAFETLEKEKQWVAKVGQTFSL
jgi:hypothetical protein